MFIGMVQSESKQAVNGTNDEHAELKSEVWIAPLLVNNTIVLLKLNTGAKKSLINWSDSQNLKVRPIILNKTVALRAYIGQSIKKHCQHAG